MLGSSALRPPDIDLFIYVGIGGGFHKLGNAYILAKTLGIHHAECFDILDACMSWTRALSLANSLFKTRHIRNALLVNAEFNVIAGAASYPGNCVVRNAQELEYLLPWRPRGRRRRRTRSSMSPGWTACAGWA